MRALVFVFVFLAVWVGTFVLAYQWLEGRS